MAAKTKSEFMLMTPAARATWMYSALLSEVASLRAECVTDPSAHALIVDADNAASARLAAEIQVAQVALADTLRRAYLTAKAG